VKERPELRCSVRKRTFSFRPKPVIDANKAFVGSGKIQFRLCGCGTSNSSVATETLPGRRLANKKLGLSPAASLTSIHGI
jgi:hypothetical protein